MPADDPYPFPILASGPDWVMPDLAKIPKDRWRDALAPLRPAFRDGAVRRLRDPGEQFDAMLIAGDCARADDEVRNDMRRAAMGAGFRAPAPDARPGPSRSRSVNVRLYPRDYARLARAAELMAATPTELARMLIVRGTARVLEEAPERGKP
jgi:hypothetical protein